MDLTDKGLKIPQDNTDWEFIGQNYILAIGINNYEHWPVLNNAVGDVKAIIQLLNKDYQFENDKIITLFNAEATEDNILAKLEYCCQIMTEHDNLIIIYSGHGHYNFNQGYWIPSNARQGRPADYIPNSTVLKYVAEVKALHKFLIVDSCFSGALIQYKGDTVPSERFPSCRIFASGRKEVVSDGEPGKHSPFADAIINELTYTEDSFIRSSQLIVDVISAVETSAGQKPIEGRNLEAGDKNGEFVFHRKNTPGSSEINPELSLEGRKNKTKTNKEKNHGQGQKTNQKRVHYSVLGLIGLVLLTLVYFFIIRPNSIHKEIIDPTSLDSDPPQPKFEQTLLYGKWQVRERDFINSDRKMKQYLNNYFQFGNDNSMMEIQEQLSGSIDTSFGSWDWSEDSLIMTFSLGMYKCEVQELNNANMIWHLYFEMESRQGELQYLELSRRHK